jgi:hypothetical protein
MYSASTLFSVGRKRTLRCAVMELPEAGERELPHRALSFHHKSVVKIQKQWKKEKNGVDTKKGGKRSFLNESSSSPKRLPV